MRPLALSLYRPLEGARARIAAFPHAGGGASAFAKLGVALRASGVELCPLQAPGRENRLAERHHDSVEAVATEFAAAIKTLPPLPTAFLGHSLGGLVAYLTARLLAKNRNAPDHLVVSGSLSPVLPQAGRPLSDNPTLGDQLLALGGIPEAILADPTLYDLFETVIKLDIAAGHAYRHSAAKPLPFPITVYSGQSDRAAPPALASAWRPLTSAEFQTREFDGGHFFLYADPTLTASSLLEDLNWRGIG